jgi:replication factor C small subunit
MLGKQMFDRATLILAEQNIEFEKKSVIDVVMKFFPDYRRTLNELQRYASATGKIDAEIVKLATSNSIDDLVKAIKAKSFKETKLWISANIGNMSQEAVYRKLYDSATQVVAPQSVPQLILILSQYQFQGVTAPDPELNLMACCITCMAELEFV